MSGGLPVGALEGGVIDACDDEGDVMSAEAEAVIDGVAAGFVEGGVGYVVQIAFRVWCVVVDCGWEGSGGECEGAGGHFDGAGGPDHVSEHAFYGADMQMFSVFSKDGPEGDGFHGIVVVCACAVGADVGFRGDGIWFESGFCEGELDCADGLLSLGVRLSEVEGVTGGASAEDFGPGFSSAFSEVLFGFKDKYGGTFAHDKPAAVGIEGFHGLFGSIIAGFVHGPHIDE
ncbi:MAG: hypothetical protein RL215_1378 [Planctomycetota bacterium]